MLRVITHLPTIDPNFQQDIQVPNVGPAGYGNLCDFGKPCYFHQDGSENWKGWNFNTAALTIETESCLFPVFLKPGVFCIGKFHVQNFRLAK